MRLKYQLRGLGIGIILTAALLMIFSDDGDASAKQTDVIVAVGTENVPETQEVEVQSEIPEEDIQTVSIEAEEDKVTEEAEIKESEMESTTEEMTTQEPATENSQTEERSEAESASEIQTEAESESETNVKPEVESPQLDSADAVTIKIVSGDDSGTVARKLQTAGLVEDAREFDAYLMQHGYDKRIATGEKIISKSATWQEIAETISRR